MGFSTTNFDGSLDRDLNERYRQEVEQEALEEEIMRALGKEEPSRAHAALMEALREKVDEWADVDRFRDLGDRSDAPRRAKEIAALLTASTKRLGRYWSAYSEWLNGNEDTEASRMEWAREQAAIEAAKPRGDGDE